MSIGTIPPTTEASSPLQARAVGTYAGQQQMRGARAHAARQRRTALIVLGLTLLAGGLRAMVTRSIWLDEAISVAQAKLPFWTMLTTIAERDVHPPLHHMLLWVAVHGLGDGELAVRAPSIIAGTLLVPLLFVTARELYGREVGLMAAAMGAVAPIGVWYSQEARMYALFMLFGLAAIWAQLRVVRNGGPVFWAFYVLATAALLWSHYFALLQVLVQQLGFAAAAWQHRSHKGAASRMLRAWAAATVVLLVLLAPLAMILQNQLAVFVGDGGAASLPQQAGLGVAQDRAEDGLSIYAIIANAIWALWGYHANSAMAQIVALWPLGMLGMLVLLGRGRSKVSLFIVAVAVVPPVVLFGVGLVRRNLFELRYFIGAVPLGLLLAARCITSSRSRLGRVVMAVLLLASLTIGLADQQLNGDNPRLYDFRGALSQITAEAGPDDLLLFEPLFVGPVVDYYAPGLRAAPLDGGIPSRRQARRIYLLGSFFDDPVTAGQVGEALHLLSKKRRKVIEIQEPNVRVWVFQ